MYDVLFLAAALWTGPLDVPVGPPHPLPPIMLDGDLLPGTDAAGLPPAPPLTEIITLVVAPEIVPVCATFSVEACAATRCRERKESCRVAWLLPWRAEELEFAPAACRKPTGSFLYRQLYCPPSGCPPHPETADAATEVARCLGMPSRPRDESTSSPADQR